MQNMQTTRQSAHTAHCDNRDQNVNNTQPDQVIAQLQHRWQSGETIGIGDLHRAYHEQQDEPQWQSFIERVLQCDKKARQGGEQ